MYGNYNDDEDIYEQVYEQHRRKLENLTLDELKVLNDFHYIRLNVITSLIEEKHQELGAIGELADEDYIYLQGPLHYTRSSVRARSISPVRQGRRGSPGARSISPRARALSPFRRGSPSRGGSPHRSGSGSPFRSESTRRGGSQFGLRSGSPSRGRDEGSGSPFRGGSPGRARSESAGRGGSPVRARSESPSARARLEQELNQRGSQLPPYRNLLPLPSKS